MLRQALRAVRNPPDRRPAASPRQPCSVSSNAPPQKTLPTPRKTGAAARPLQESEEVALCHNLAPKISSKNQRRARFATVFVGGFRA
jgi:hypothetical protein